MLLAKLFAILKPMAERVSGDPDLAPIYTISKDLLQIIAQDAIGRTLSKRELDDVLKTIVESMYEHLIDCIEASLRYRNSVQILENDQVRGPKLFPEDVRATLPSLYANEEQGLNAIALVKFFLPGSYWTWYASEYDGQDTFFGLVVGHHIELGYFSYKELACLQGPNGQVVERDLYFNPLSLEKVKAKHEMERSE